jgi:hypothetical protein
MFYVYELRDPANNLPFYVGKGTRVRMTQHVRDVNYRVTVVHYFYVGFDR